MPSNNRTTNPPNHTGRNPDWPPFGRTTQKFFVEGERHEASGWEDTVLPPDDDPHAHKKPKVGDFDIVPRQTASTVVLAVFSACLTLGVVLGVKALVRTGRRVDASATQLKHQMAAQPSAVVPAPDAGASPTDNAVSIPLRPPPR